MNRRDFVKMAPVGLAGAISSTALSGKVIKGNPVIKPFNPSVPLEQKKLTDYSRLFEVVTIPNFKGDYIKLDTPQEVLVPFYTIGAEYKEKGFLKEIHDRKVISDLEGVLGATIADINVVYPKAWDNIPDHMDHYIIDMGLFSGTNHIDLRCSQRYELLIPKHTKIGKIIRCGLAYKQKNQLWFSKERVAIIGYNEHIFVRPFKEENYA